MNTEKFARKIGFTARELNVILFLAGIFLISVALKFIFTGTKTNIPRNFNYSKEDSIFLNQIYGNSYVNDSPVEKEDAGLYKEKVLRLSGTQQTFEKKTLPALSSIDINTADIKTLSRLPGIGTKTAEKIIEYRDSKGRFSSPGELIKVKGIGKIKLDKIRPYLK
jgi:competence protein ComEA